MDYETALEVLNKWDFFSLPDGDKVINAITKSRQALRDCIDIGLDGKGDY